jgi:superfamily I DNA and RNA helicase
MFGKDTDGQPRISLDRSSRDLPPGAFNDTVLSKCYRNQREVLVTAHALGFGIYKQIVQLLESAEHWEDVGYNVLSGEDFKVGKNIKIERPVENNPISLITKDVADLIKFKLADNLHSEISWIASEIESFLKGGLHAEDFVVVALDDRNARAYFKHLSASLASKGIASNNILADPYSEPPFQIQGKVTLSTVYRAKGNEAAVVFAIGVDAVNTSTRSGRNKLFTAFTRSKAWLRISGIGAAAGAVQAEIETALDHFPMLDFVMPDLAEVEMIQRDLSHRTARTKKARIEIVKNLKASGFSDSEIEEILTMEKSDEST